ncbi:radical SAM protein [Oceanomicrobium pacificus]|uniref:Radical SAM protein n=1 Tax=Oceanomicrobium pacificus TaxID=2692916 RepID=A0A6B0TXT1_9RHOB|nr:radical SAM protein [Oceanomicrobium pacificus]MXU66258.1 radical SAM protein [Oceanomicrobium pacificus]
MTEQTFSPDRARSLRKFEDPDLTAKGETRAQVALAGLKTLWFNTGTLCNIACTHCYIESTPQNDRLVYLTTDEIRPYFEEIERDRLPVTEIAFTGGEPFMNPQMIDMAEVALARGFEVLILTNAMRPMMRPRVRDGLARLNAAYPGKMTLRISLDHFRRDLHDEERGDGTYDVTLAGMRWLRDAGIPMAVAGRTLWGDTDAESRAGYAALFKAERFDIDAADPGQTVLFPEMDEQADVPEITTACWGILGKRPEDVMCASSRMVVKRKGAAHPVVLSCTLLAYDTAFEMGRTLRDAARPVKLNHPHCAKFCVLGGASCSA